MITPEYSITPIKFVNTSLFQEAGNHFLKHGTYTFAPSGTFSYQEYWDEEERRCKEGYTVGGVRITGEHYAYLNYARIKITVGDGKKARKYESFPRFLDMDYYYYHELEQAKLNKEGIIVAKSRRKGFSYKGAFNCVYEYNWFRDSFSIIAAFMGDYCQTTMNMALDMINFINKYTDWGKRKLIDTRNHIRSGYKEKINNIEVESGYKSEIMTISFKDNPFKSIGKSGSIMLFEEAGKWSGLIDAYMLSKPLFSDGDIMIGIPIIYGTGGDMESGTLDFCEMFYNPTAYNLRAYQNIWDENKVGECGWFVDDMWFKLPHVDKEGNSNRVLAEEELDLQRNLLLKSGTKKAFEKFITQNPKSPAEAFLRTTGNLFPTADLLNTLTKIEVDPKYKDAEYIGELIINDLGQIEWKNNPKLFPIREFPLKTSDDTEGCIVIYEMPYDEDGVISYGRYIGGIDPYDHDESKTGSLGSTLIFDTYTNRIVAEYTARPETAEEYYENVRRLLEFYNATALYENEKKGIFTYFTNKYCDYLLSDTPEIIRDIIQDSTVNRKKGMHMVTGLKTTGEDFVNSFLREKVDDSGVLNLHKLRSVPLIKELIAFDQDGNYDRVMALMMVIYYRNDRIRFREKKKNVIKRLEDSDFFKKPMFQRKNDWSTPIQY